MKFNTFLRWKGEYLDYVGSEWDANIPAVFN